MLYLYSSNINETFINTEFFLLSMNKKEVWKKIKDYRSNFKNEIDSHVDPLLFRIAANGAMLWGGNEGLDYISKNTENWETVAMVGGYAVLGASIYYGNKFIINPIAKKIKNIKAKRFYDGNLVGAESWLRTSTQIGGLATLYFLSSFNTAINNYKYDIESVLGSSSNSEKRIELEQELTDKVMEDFPVKKNGGPFDTGALEGYTLSGLYSTITGINGKVPKKVDVDFDTQLLKMFNIKSKISDNKVIDNDYKERVQEYIDSTPTYMTLEQYIDEADNSVHFIKDNLDWNKVGKLKGLNEHESKLLESIAKSLNGRDLLGYGLTELMPSQTDGKKNMAALDFLLRNAGREYVELIPAMGDKLTSHGTFQFTPYAIYNANGEVRGASIINLALPPDKRIPDSVIKLRGNDHFKAAYMFATGNIAEMIKGLSRSRQSKLETKGAKNKSELIKYVAASHYKPVYARKSANQWIDNGCNDDFLKTVHSQVESYALKTHVNWHALYGLEAPKITKNISKNTKNVNKNNNQVNPLKEMKDHAGGYIDTKTYNSKRMRMFKYVVKKKDNPTAIARNFNEWDKKIGDKYQDIIYTSVVQKNGQFAQNISPGQQVYVLARSKM